MWQESASALEMEMAALRTELGEAKSTICAHESEKTKVGSELESRDADLKVKLSTSKVCCFCNVSV